jgi:hypothetical protein
MFDFSTASENLKIRQFVFSMACLGDAIDRATGGKKLRIYLFDAGGDVTAGGVLSQLSISACAGLPELHGAV